VGARRLAVENEALKEQVRVLEEKVAALAIAGEGRSRTGKTIRSAKQKSGGPHAG